MADRSFYSALHHCWKRARCASCEGPFSRPRLHLVEFSGELPARFRFCLAYRIDHVADRARALLVVWIAPHARCRGATRQGRAVGIESFGADPYPHLLRRWAFVSWPTAPCWP